MRGLHSDTVPLASFGVSTLESFVMVMVSWCLPPSDLPGFCDVCQYLTLHDSEALASAVVLNAKTDFPCSIEAVPCDQKRDEGDEVVVVAHSCCAV